VEIGRIFEVRVAMVKWVHTDKVTTIAWPMPNLTDAFAFRGGSHENGTHVDRRPALKSAARSVPVSEAASVGSAFCGCGVSLLPLMASWPVLRRSTAFLCRSVSQLGHSSLMY
jgi:hypothetical protein